MSEATTETTQGQVPRLQNRLSAAINILHEEIDGLDTDLSAYMHDPNIENEAEAEPSNPPLCTAADYLRDKAFLIDDASEKLQKIFRRIQI